MGKGAFRVYRDPDNPRDIKFENVAGEEVSIPEDQLELRDEIDRTLTVLRMLFPENDKKFEEYFRPLLSLAQAGLVGNSAQPALAYRALLVLKNEIVDREGGQIKNQYMKKLGKYAIVISVPALLGAGVIHWQFSKLANIGNFLLLWVGCMAGVWLSFGVRKTFLRFEELHIPEEDRLEPIIRLIFAGLLTVIIGLLFATKAVVINIGSVDSSQITTSPVVALLVGMLCGFSEKALPSTVARQASELLKFGR